MRTFAASSLSLNKVDEYFARLNPTAERISFDIRDMKDTYGDLWNTFNANEQNDIINETLINPEISLKYFDKFLTLSLMDDASPGGDCESADSSEHQFMKNFNSPKEITSYPKNMTKDMQMKIFGFDGRNLKTYGAQRVALKTIPDDVSGRDEHSSPFSYRTKSQINLFNADNNKEESKTALNGGDNLGKPSNYKNNELTESLGNYKIELKKTMNARNNFTKHPIDNSKDMAVVKEIWDLKNRVLPKSLFRVQPKTGTPSRTHVHTNSATSAAGPSKNHAVCHSDVYEFVCEYEENSSLMQNISGANNLASSANTSDDDHYDECDYECEDVKLLDNEITLKKGFDFLNNW